MNGLIETIKSNPHIKSVWIDGNGNWSIKSKDGYKEVSINDLSEEKKTVVSVKKSKKNK